MELQNGRGNLGSHGAEEGIAHDLRLVFATHHNEHLLGGHDGANAHGVCLARHFVGGIKQAAVRVNGGFREVNAVGFLREFRRRLVEADVAVVAQAQKLQVNAASEQNGSLVGIACGLSVGVGAIGHMRVLGAHVDLAEQVLLHEVVVALLVIGRQAAIFVQIERCNAREVDTLGFVALGDFGVEALRRGAGGQAQHAARLFLDQVDNHVGGGFAHFLIVFGHENLHERILLFVVFCDYS